MLAAAVALGAEATHAAFHALAARRGDAGSGPEVLVVLGYPSRRNGRPHPVQRWRCQIARRSLDAAAARSTLVFTGRGRPGQASEAATMAAHFARLGAIHGVDVVIEEQAASTWQNIELSLPHLRHAGRVKLVSDPIHAARAGRYLAALEPDVAARRVPVADYRLLEHPLLKVGTAAYELLNAARKRVPVPR